MAKRNCDNTKQIELRENLLRYYKSQYSSYSGSSTRIRLSLYFRMVKLGRKIDQLKHTKTS